MKKEINRDYEIRNIHEASSDSKNQHAQDVDEFIAELAEQRISEFEKNMKSVNERNHRQLMLSYKHPFERVNKKLYSTTAQTGERRLVKHLRRSVSNNEAFMTETKSTDANSLFSHIIKSA